MVLKLSTIKLAFINNHLVSNSKCGKMDLKNRKYTQYMESISMVSLMLGEIRFLFRVK